MRRRAHTRLKALLTIAASRGVVERVRSMCIQLSLISSAGHSLHQAISPIVFSDFQLFFLISLLQLFFNFFMAEHHFLLFSFPCFYYLVSCPFFLSSCLVKGSDGRGQNTSSREMSESSGGNGHQDLKKRRSLLLACF